ncbi:MAG: ATP-binding protein, partial [Planctomycetes bacterium]|nr:ATP-binding protein [Planctomycetota bacterium]
KEHASKPATAIEARFELTEEGMKSLEELFGEGAITENEVAIEKRYNNVRYFAISHDEAIHVRHLVAKAGLPDSIAKNLSKTGTFKELLMACRQIDNPAKSLQDFHYQLEQWHDQPLMKRMINALDIPTFFYFSEYSLMPGSISISELKDASEGQAAQESHYTALALVQRIGAKLDDFLDLSNYETLKAELEDASNRITDEVYGYWTQHSDIEFEFSLQPVMNDAKVHVDTLLHLRIRNRADRVSVPFDKRSRGFVWFFSFIVAFSQYRNEGNRVLLVLDEPGHSLHPKAQRDLLRYLEAEVAPYHQVLYSTHSPFMIDTAKTERVRVVADGGSGRGTYVTDDASELDPEANFTLRAALAFDLAEGLFEGIYTLIVAKPADVIWLRVVSELLSAEGRTGLSEAWTVVPAGASGRVAAYVSLLGMNNVNLGVFLSLAKDERKRLEGLFESREIQ